MWTPQAINLHDKKVNTLHLEPAAEKELASSCSDGSVALWDVRKLTASSIGVVQPIATAGHSFTCQAAYFAPNGAHSLVLQSDRNSLLGCDPNPDPDNTPDFN